jgi:hypothetical protein
MSGRRGGAEAQRFPGRQRAIQSRASDWWEDERAAEAPAGGLMRREGERGEGKLTMFLWLAFFAAVVFAAWHVAPVYIDHYALVDKVNAPKWSHPDDKINELLMKYVREERLDGWVTRNSFTISTVDTGRRITVNYHREVEILPGWKHDFKFSKQIDQPLVY